MSHTDNIPAVIPEAAALRAEWDDLHRRLKPLHVALCGLLAAVHLTEERTSAIAVRWVQSQGGTADEQDAALDAFLREAGVEPVAAMLVDLAGRL